MKKGIKGSTGSLGSWNRNTKIIEHLARDGLIATTDRSSSVSSVAEYLYMPFDPPGPQLTIRISL